MKRKLITFTFLHNLCWASKEEEMSSVGIAHSKPSWNPLRVPAYLVQVVSQGWMGRMFFKERYNTSSKISDFAAWAILNLFPVSCPGKITISTRREFFLHDPVLGPQMRKPFSSGCGCFYSQNIVTEISYLFHRGFQALVDLILLIFMACGWI